MERWINREVWLASLVFYKILLLLSQNFRQFLLRVRKKSVIEVNKITSLTLVILPSSTTMKGSVTASKYFHVP
jgi:hypothetical protein